MVVEFNDKEIQAVAGWKAWRAGRAETRVFSDLKVSATMVSGLLKEGRKKTRTVVKRAEGEWVPHCSCAEFYATNAFCQHAVALLLQAREVSSEPPRPTPQGVPADLHISATLAQPLAVQLQQTKLSLTLRVTPSGEAHPPNAQALSPLLLAFGVPLEEGAHLIQLPRESMTDLLRLHAQSPFIEGLAGSASAPRFPIQHQLGVGEVTLSAPVLQDWELSVFAQDVVLTHPSAAAYHLLSGLSPVVRRILGGEAVTVPLKRYFTIGDDLLRCFDLTALDVALQQQLTPQSARFAVHFEGTVKKVAARVTVHYGDETFPLSAHPQFNFLHATRTQIQITDVPAERHAYGLLSRAGFCPTKGGLVLEGEGAILEFLAYTHPQLQREQWEISMMGGFRALARNITPLALRLQIDPYTPHDDYVSMQYSFETQQGQGLKSADAQRLVQSGKQSFKLKTGRIALLSRQEFTLISAAVQDCDPQQSAGKYLVPRQEVAYLLNLGIPLKGEFKPQPEEVPPLTASSTVIAQLRDYQREGVAWLLDRLRRHRCALLADDMGLGKTVQSLAVLDCLAKGQATLIICPASLIPNWEAELARWLPNYDASSVTIISYQKYLRDASLHHSTDYQLCLLDEASMIKNPDAKVTKALYEQPAQYKLALTGTPLENTAADLWSIFRFLSPRYLGKRKHFQERFVKPLQTSGHSAALTQKRLRAKLQPLVLRRTKQAVLTELPPKTYRIDYCAATPTQQKEFARVKQEYAELKETQQSGESTAQIQILTSILRLRQIANDPALISDDFSQLAPKTKRLLEILEQAKALNKKVLVFSQFAKMLEVLHTQLGSHGHSCSILTGATKDREAQIQSFRQENSVFLISLKAGGYGLNLTEASIVVHLDPWWNPAVENQATDRAYRMGQSEPVSVIKLITQGSIDERILTLQSQKQDLYSTTIEDQSQVTSGITQRELLSLIQ